MVIFYHTAYFLCSVISLKFLIRSFAAGFKACLEQGIASTLRLKTLNSFATLALQPIITTISSKDCPLALPTIKPIPNDASFKILGKDSASVLLNE